MPMAVLHCDYCLYIKNHYVILIEILFGIDENQPYRSNNNQLISYLSSNTIIRY